MFSALEAGIGLEIVLWLQSFENPLLSAIAEVFAQLGGDLGYLVLLPLIYWSIDRRLGRWLLVVLSLALFVLIGAKELFERPRPYIFAPDEVQLLISPSDGFGFPSGHVGLTMALWGFVALWAGRRWGYALLATYALGMAWARMYGGVHFPQDVIVGFLLGGAIAGGTYAARQQLSLLGSRLPLPAWVMILIVASAAMAALLVNDDAGVSGAGILLGGGLGALLSDRTGNFTAAGPTIQRALRFSLGIIITLITFILLDLAFAPLSPEPIFRVVRYALVTFTIIGLVPLLLKRLNLTQPTVSPVGEPPQSVVS